MPIPIPSSANKEKQTLRQAYQQQPMGDSHKVCANAWEILKKEIDRKVHRIALYMPLKTEVDCTDLIENLAMTGYSLYLPVVQNDKMPLIFVPYRHRITILHRHQGIAEPQHTKEQGIPTHICMPVIAFDTEKYRLGYGKGLYDRTINAYRHRGYGTRFYGLAFNNRKHEVLLPRDAHDAKLDAIITETQCIQ